MKMTVEKALLPEQTLAQAKRLVGFDLGQDFYHVLLFDFGDEGCAIGIWQEGDNFCARISLDALATFHKEAKAMHIEGSA